MSLGGFVIHGNSVQTLGACLESLSAVCDEVVAVDGGSTDGSSELVRKLGARAVQYPWRGYGAARAKAASELTGCDYLFYLDSDERLEPESIQALQRWRASKPTAPAYGVDVRDWAELSTGRFLYRTHQRARLVRSEVARWTPGMIVHESLSIRPSARTGAFVEHRFATDVDLRAQKEERYALLWAVRALAEGRRSKPTWLQRPAHVLRDLLVHGALWRGGAMAARLAWAVSGYHARKYAWLDQLRKGRHPELARAFAEGRFDEVFELTQTAVSGSSQP